MKNAKTITDRRHQAAKARREVEGLMPGEKLTGDEPDEEFYELQDWLIERMAELFLLAQGMFDQTQGDTLELMLQALINEGVDVERAKENTLHGRMRELVDDQLSQPAGATDETDG